MMNKRELIYSIAEQTGYTQSAVRKVLNTFIDTVFNEVKSENKVRIGGLGVFSPVLQKSRPVEPIMLAPRTTIKFRTADDLVRKLNNQEK